MKKVRVKTKQPEVLLAVEKPVLTHKERMRNAIDVLTTSADFAELFTSKSDSIYTSIGFYNVCICNVGLPIIDTVDKAIVGIQGFIYTEDTNIYICINKDVSLQHRNYTKAMLLSYVVLNFARVVRNSGVVDAFAVFHKDSSTKLLCDTVDSSVEYLTNFIVQRHLSTVSAEVQSELYSPAVLTAINENNNNYEYHNVFGYFMMNYDTNVILRITYALNSVVHVVYTDSFSTSKVELGYNTDSTENIDAILSEYDKRCNNKSGNSHIEKIRFSETSFKLLQAYRKSDINFIASLLALNFDFDDYDTFNNILNSVLSMKDKSKNNK